MQPAQGIGEHPQDKCVVSVLRLGDAVIECSDGLGVFSQPDVGEAAVTLAHQFDDTVVHVCCHSPSLLRESNRPLELSTPVRRLPKLLQSTSDNIMETSRLPDAQGLFELSLSF